MWFINLLKNDKKYYGAMVQHSVFRVHWNWKQNLQIILKQQGIDSWVFIKPEKGFYGKNLWNAKLLKKRIKGHNNKLFP